MSPISENISPRSVYLDDDNVGLFNVKFDGLWSIDGDWSGAYGCALTGVDAFDAAGL